MTKPKYQAITNAEMGKFDLPDGGGSVEVIAGNFNETKGAATTFSPVHLYNLKLKKESSLDIESTGKLYDGVCDDQRTSENQRN